MLLKKSSGTWTIVSLGTDLSRGEAIALGAPQSIADFIGYAETSPTKPCSTPRSWAASPCEGEQLYLVVGASSTPRQEAQSPSIRPRPLFGDMQAYYIIQLADNFEGLRSPDVRTRRGL